MILAAARSLFGENGPRNVTIRSLTARSGITAPTIYKLVGGRDAVLEAALLESLANCIDHAPVVAEDCDINVICGYVETLWLSTRLQPGYSRHQIDLNWRAPGGRRLAAIFRENSIDALTRWLMDLCDRDRLAAVASPHAIATAIEAHMRMTFIDWADGCGNLIRLRRTLATGIVVILTGLVGEREQRRMRAWLDRLEDENPALIRE